MRCLISTANLLINDVHCFQTAQRRQTDSVNQAKRVSSNIGTLNLIKIERSYGEWLTISQPRR